MVMEQQPPPPQLPVARVQDVVATFRPCRDFKAPSPSVYTSIDFDDQGEFLLLSRTDDTVQLYNIKAGQHAKELKTHKYGSALARFTHHSTSIIYASTKYNDDIRYLSMHDNSYIRYFKGHQGRVTCLTLSPNNDTFMSGSLDNTVKLWDARSQSAQGQMNFESPWFTAYDASGSVMAIASPPAQAIVLYDARNYDKPPFATFDLLEKEDQFRSLGQRGGEGWLGMEFSNNGKYLMVSTNGPGHYILDAFSGELIHYLKKPGGPDYSHFAPGTDLPANASTPGNTPSFVQSSACFSPDGRYVISGNGRKASLSVWDCSEEPKQDRVLEPCAELPSQKPTKVVAYNPRYNLLATADKEMMMWLPDPDSA